MDGAVRWGGGVHVEGVVAHHEGELELVDPADLGPDRPLAVNEHRGVADCAAVLVRHRRGVGPTPGDVDPGRGLLIDSTHRWTTMGGGGGF